MAQPPLHLWNEFVKSQPMGSLYQTSIWSHFQAKIPGKEKGWFITVQNPDNPKEILGGGLVVLRSLPFGLSWLECPRGPVFHENLYPEKIEVFFEMFFELVKKTTHEYKVIHIRIDPPIQKNTTVGENYELACRKMHLKKAHASYFPETTLVIDLMQSEEDMLKQMKQKGRYNIKIAEKHGIIVRHVDRRNVAEFHEMIQKTGARDGFHIHDLAYYESMLEALGDSAALWMAYNGTKPVAGLIATYFGDVATYYYGASSYDDRQLMAPYLLQWKVMLDAKEKGYAKYDLLGIATLDASGSPQKSHPLAGVTDFKTKFGGTVISYEPAKEYIIRPFWHFAMRARKWLRK